MLYRGFSKPKRGRVSIGFQGEWLISTERGRVHFR